MSFALLALICAVAILGPLVSLGRMMRVPVVIGELAVGVVLGTTGFGVVDANEPMLEFLAQIGFALVMFVAGSHVPIRRRAMLGGLAAGALRAFGIAAVAVPLGIGIAALFGTGHGALYAVLIASSSATIVMPALGKTEVRSRSGLEMLAQLAIADALCIIAVPLVLDPAHVVRSSLGALAVLAVAGVFFLLMDWAERTGRRERMHRVSKTRGLAMELRINLALLFTLAAVATTMHVSVMLAGFAMGLAVSAVGEPRRVANQTFALTEGFLGPIFFVWLGASLDLRQLISNPASIWLGVALGAVALLAHGLGALTRQPLPLAVSTAAQLGVPVGAAALGKTMGVIQAGEATALLLGAVVTIVVVTLLNRRVVALVSQAPTGAAGPGTGSGLPNRQTDQPS
ncbi:MAG: cation:proton antiporter [Actinobacteria bacterium]|nr:cation:proton antiporter [Actinomycetota bacterium]